MKYGTLQNIIGEPLETVFEVAAGLGFDGVELDWMKIADLEDGGALAPSRRPGVRERAAKAGVEICSFAAHLLNGINLAHPDAASRRKGIDAARMGLVAASELGAPLMLMPFFGPMDHGAAGLDRMIENLKRISSDAERARVRAAIEHPLRGDIAAEVIDRVNSPWIGDYWDMANGLALGYDPIREIHSLERRIMQVHAKEFFAESGPTGTIESDRYDALNTVPFGQGEVPVAEVLKALRETGYDGYIVLETGGFEDRHQAARDAMDLLKRYNSAG